MANPQLKLVSDPAPGFNPDTQDPTRQIFEHWLYLLGRSPRRCKLGPTRRQAIDAALAIGYDTDTVLLAIEGMAADPLLGARDERMRDAMREIEWLLAREARIERWAGLGEQLRAELAAPPPQQPAADVIAIDPVAEAQHRERLRQRAAAMRGCAHG